MVPRVGGAQQETLPPQCGRVYCHNGTRSGGLSVPEDRQPPPSTSPFPGGSGDRWWCPAEDGGEAAQQPPRAAVCGEQPSAASSPMWRAAQVRATPQSTAVQCGSHEVGVMRWSLDGRAYCTPAKMKEKQKYNRKRKHDQIWAKSYYQICAMDILCSGILKIRQGSSSA